MANPNGIIKKSLPRYQQALLNASGWWNHNKPQLMKDFPITDVVAPTLNYITGRSSVAPMPVSVGKLTPSTKYFDKLYHYSDNPNLSFNDIDLRRVGVSQMKKKYRSLPIEERPGGFYTTKNYKDVFMGGNQGYEMYIPKTSKIADLASQGRVTDRIPLRELNKLSQEGYDIIKGKNMIGKEEWIPLNKDKILGWNKFTNDRVSFRKEFNNGGIIKFAKPLQRKFYSF